MNEKLKELIQALFIRFMGATLSEAESKAIEEAIQRYIDEELVKFTQWVHPELVENWDDTLKEFKERNK